MSLLRNVGLMGPAVLPLPAVLQVFRARLRRRLRLTDTATSARAWLPRAESDTLVLGEHAAS